MTRVVIESPLKGNDGDYETNRAYAKACMLDSLRRGESPYASHLLFDQPGLLHDSDDAERQIGMAAGFEWGTKADLVAVYTDRGISEGMARGIESHKAAGIPIEYREGITIPEMSALTRLLQGIASDPKGTRVLVVTLDPGGEMAQRMIGPFQIWEMQGIARFLEVQFELAATQSILSVSTGFTNQGGGDKDDSDRIIG